MKATAMIDLPDGWELADTEIRPPRKGEWFIGANNSVCSASVDHMTPMVIVRRIAEQYVNVRLRRKDAVWLEQTWPEASRGDDSIASLWEVAAACREALSERCGAKFDNPSWVANGWRDQPSCTLPAGHAGPHGV